MAPPKQAPPSPTVVALGEAQNLLQLWIKIRAFLAKALTDEPISPDDERHFLEAKSDTSRFQRTLGLKLPEYVNYGSDKIQEILRQSISISHLRGLPKADKQNLMASWHAVFVYLSQALGVLQFINEGYDPPPRQRKAGTGLKDLKGAAAGDSAKKPQKKGFFSSPFGIVVILGIIGGIIYFVMNQ
jgi:hypothetical protein